jgi:tetratricopeptide (TPR) repeat protein
MCCPAWETKAADDGSTKKPSSFSAADSSVSLEKRTEELELLWKLGRRDEALKLADELLAGGAQHTRLYITAGFIYLDAGRVSKAEDLVRRLEKSGASGENLDLLRGSLYIQQEKWKEAKPVYQRLFEQSSDRTDMARIFAYVLRQTHEWKEARIIYKDLLAKNPKSKELLWDYRSVLEEGAPRIESGFQYWHRPAGQRDYRLGQKASFWVNPWLRIGTGVTEEVYRRGDFNGLDAINRLVMSHILEGHLFYGKLASLLMGWRSSYDKNEYQELYWRLHVDRKPIKSELSFDWNQLARDPIEAIAKEGRINRLEMKNELTALKRLQFGHISKFEWYRLPGKNNEVNGASDLGHDLSNDAYVNLVILEKPYLAMNYHYKQSYWDRKFPGADTVIGYLPAEMAHYGGFYTEHPVGKWMEFASSVTRGYDHKRNANYLYWYFEDRIWIADRLRVIFSWEYDIGDSGTAGPGDSQIFSTKAEIYF